MEIKEISITDDIYPEYLKAITDPPQKLYAIGNLELLRLPCIAIVGTRRASPYGRWVAFELAKRIAKVGVCIVSGMAEGIDSCAHRGALAAEGKTIAVLGTGVDVCFPKSGADIYRELSNCGLILSEYEPGSIGYPGNFPKRNRIISGLSRKVIVVEGAYKSGSMITARLANEQGRDVYAVPGNINQPNSEGVNYLIYDGAIPILNIDSCLETLGIETESHQQSLLNMSGSERELYTYVRGNPGTEADKILSDLLMSETVGLRLITAMELKGFLRREGNRVFVTI